MTGSDHVARAAVPALEDIAREHPGVTATVRAECQHLQALEDAIAYRRARVSAPCPDCTASGQKCDDHACDLNLIAVYQRTAITILNASSQTDAIRGNHPPAPATKPSAPSPASPEPPMPAPAAPSPPDGNAGAGNPTCGVPRLSSHRSCPDPATHGWTGGRDG
jgi:hypothetical protein